MSNEKWNFCKQVVDQDAVCNAPAVIEEFINVYDSEQGYWYPKCAEHLGGGPTRPLVTLPWSHPDADPMRDMRNMKYENGMTGEELAEFYEFIVRPLSEKLDIPYTGPVSKRYLQTRYDLRSRAFFEFVCNVATSMQRVLDTHILKADVKAELTMQVERAKEIGKRIGIEQQIRYVNPESDPVKNIMEAVNKNYSIVDPFVLIAVQGHGYRIQGDRDTSVEELMKAAWSVAQTPENWRDVNWELKTRQGKLLQGEDVKPFLTPIDDQPLFLDPVAGAGS